MNVRQQNYTGRDVLVCTDKLDGVFMVKYSATGVYDPEVTSIIYDIDISINDAWYDEGPNRVYLDPTYYPDIEAALTDVIETDGIKTRNGGIGDYARLYWEPDN